MTHARLNSPTLPPPPNPSGLHDLERVDQQRLRRRMLYGGWKDDLKERLRDAVGHIREEAWRLQDYSSNVFRSSVTSLAVLYDRPGTFTVEGEDVAELVHLVREAGWWSMMSRVQRDTLGIREMFVRIDVRGKGENARVVYRPVFPDLTDPKSRADQPDIPVRMKEALPRKHPVTGRRHWTWDVLDISDPENPSYRVLEASGEKSGEDLSEAYLGVKGGLVGAAYPYRWADGTPFLPYATYHASHTAELFDAFELFELVEGALNCAVLWSLFFHCVRNASWPQRYAAGVEGAEGEEVEGETEGTKRSQAVADPATVLILQLQRNFEGQPVIGQWQPGADPEKLQQAIALYERRVAGYAGISPADIQRVAGDPRSGYALAITREAQREAQQRFDPQFRRADQDLLAKTAALVNRAKGTKLPESGYRMSYGAIPASAEEMKANRDQLEWEEKEGLVSPVQKYMRLHPGVDETRAENAVLHTRLETMRIEQQTKMLAEAAGLIDTSQREAASGVVIEQVRSVVAEVARGEYPRESGIGILTRNVGLSKEAAEEILSRAGTDNFTPPADDAA